MSDDAIFYGEFGGRYVAEVLRQPLVELEAAFKEVLGDPGFAEELREIANNYIARPTPILFARNLTEEVGGANIYIKLEGLAHTGAHKINNAAGQALLAKRIGKKRIIAETGAGQHGVATAAICARLGLPCDIYMGELDKKRQRPNVFRMELFGARVLSVKNGSRTLKDAVNEALRDWMGSFTDTHYLLGSALGPAPFPVMVKEFQSVIGRETERQLRERGIVPDMLIACVGGGSNAIGFFAPFLDRGSPRLLGVEAGGVGNNPGEHAARMSGEGKMGITQGYKSMLLVDDDGQVHPTHSISAGLDYPGIGPELAWHGRKGRIEFTTASDKEALDALQRVARCEGILFALESAHAAAAALKQAATLGRGKNIIVNMSGQGDKDIFITAPYFDGDQWREYLLREAEEIGGK